VRERRPEFWGDAHYKMRALVPSGRCLVDTQHQVVRRDQIELGPAVSTDYPKPQAAEAYRRIMRIAIGRVHELGHCWRQGIDTLANEDPVGAVNPHDGQIRVDAWQLCHPKVLLGCWTLLSRIVAPWQEGLPETRAGDGFDRNRKRGVSVTAEMNHESA
jgi:hypothetical protein